MLPAAHPPALVQDLLAQPRTKQVAANGILFTYREWGDPVAPLVLCLHGFPDGPSSWDALGPALAHKGYRVVAPWMRGYYPTSRPDDGDYSTTALGRDALALIAALGRQQAVLVGHDWGAAAAYAAVQQGPEHVSKLVAIAIPHPRAIPSDALLKANHFLYYPLPGAARAFAAGDIGGVDRIVKRWSPAWHPGTDELAAMKAPFRAPGGPEAILGYYRSFLGTALFRTTPPVGSIAAPTLMIYGDADGALDPAPFPASARYFTGGFKAVAFEGAGHFPQRERPDRFVATVQAFLTP
jgi:pimeloyl-ACP methyl ester carboxylesterase